MSVKLRRRRGKWWVYINWRGQRKARCVGISREAAEQVRREIEHRLALGTFSLDAEPAQPTFAEYAERWLACHVRPNLKRSTAESYAGIVKFHLAPRFGHLRLKEISRQAVKAYLAELAASGLAQNTVVNIYACLRAVLSHALDDGHLTIHPAMRLGHSKRRGAQGREREFLTREEAERFLATAKDFRPERYPLFLTALRTGLRLGELLALRWDDIHFGESESDPTRHLLVRRNRVRGEESDPKNHRRRRVDMSKELWRALMELRDQRMMEAFERGPWDESGQPRCSDYVFASETGGPLDGSNVYHRDFLPCLKAAGLKRVTFHALRHTFASLLIQSGASLAYVKEQMGHSSIQVTVDTYGHLIPGGNIEWVDRLDATKNATPAQPLYGVNRPDTPQVIENIGAGEGNRTPDLRFTKPLLYRLSYAGRHKNAHPTGPVTTLIPWVSTERRLEWRTRSAT